MPREIPLRLSLAFAGSTLGVAVDLVSIALTTNENPLQIAVPIFLLTTAGFLIGNKLDTSS